MSPKQFPREPYLARDYWSHADLAPVRGLRTKNSFIRSCERMLARQQHDLASAINCDVLAMDIRPARRCSSCGQQGHNARTCLEKDDRARPLEQSRSAAAAQGDTEQSPNRELPPMSSAVGSGYQEAPAASLSGSDTQQGTTPSPHYARERRRGTPWTEEEHRAFLAGLEKLGKGDWRGISKDFVTSRTPTQVASHAQKYFIRHNNQSKRKRRTSLFDLKAGAEAADTMRSRGSAEATSTNWPDDPAQQSAPISVQHVHKHIWQAPSQAHSQHPSAMEHASVAPNRDVPSLQGQMWYPPSGPDIALVQHYMQVTGLPVETAMLQVMSYQAAAAQGVSMPSFPTFPPPSLAEQLMAAYAAQAAAQFPHSAFPPTAFPPCAPSDVQAPMQLAGMLPQQAAAAFALLNQQQAQHHASHLNAAQHALAQFRPGVGHSRPPSSKIQIQNQEPAQHAQQAEGSSKSSPQPGCQTPSIQSESFGQHPVGKANGSPFEVGHMVSGGSNVAGSDPALCGHGRLYRPQASHAKAVAAPAVMRFGNFEESISRRSSSESIVPASGSCPNVPNRLDNSPKHQSGNALTSQPAQ